jgi:hypothetical protein
MCESLAAHPFERGDKRHLRLGSQRVNFREPRFPGLVLPVTSKLLGLSRRESGNLAHGAQRGFFEFHQALTARKTVKLPTFKYLINKVLRAVYRSAAAVSLILSEAFIFRG